MRLKPIAPALVLGKAQTLLSRCLRCRGHVRSDTGFEDLDGPPFRAYYCDACGVVLRRALLPPLPAAA